MKIAYLINDMYGIGGTVRTVANQATALSARHEVEIVSVFQHRNDPVLPVPDRVTLRPLVDIRGKETLATGEGGRPLYEGSERAGLAPLLFPPQDGRGATHSRLTDDRLEEYLASTDADVVVGTRPGLNVVIARAAPERVVKVGQEHLTYEQHSPELRAVMAAEYPKLDAFVTVTEADACTYAEKMPLPGVRLLSIPNSVPAPPFIGDGHNTRTIVSAGRLAPSKRHDLLVQAFSMVSDEFPDWTLRIYGRGSRRGALDRLVGSLGLQDRVWLMGAHPRVEEVWAQGAFAAVTSSEEPFGMTIVEAMRSGLPVVSTDCPHGPASIIQDQEDGLLVPNKSAPGIARGLARLMGDDDLRRRMSAAALSASERFDPVNVMRRYEELFYELAGSGAPDRPAIHVPRPRPAPPASCRVEVGPDGVTVLDLGPVSFGSGTVLASDRIPDTVVLTKGERRLELTPEADGRVLVDATKLDLSTGTWQVSRVDLTNPGSENGSRPEGVETPLRDLSIQQYGFPLSPSRVTELSLVIPARSVKGSLVLHVRRSPHHAEVEHVEVADGRITVRGRVLGRELPDAKARLALRPHASSQTLHAFDAAVARGGEFTAVIDARMITHGRHGDSDKWQMRLVLSDGTECTLGRHLSGVVGYKQIIEYPTQQVRPAQGAGTKVRPYYTINDRLGLKTSPVAPSLSVDRMRIRPAGRRADELRLEVFLEKPLPEGVSYAVEVVRGSHAGQRFPLREVPLSSGREEAMLVGRLPLLGHEDHQGTETLRSRWRLRLLAGPPGALSRMGAKSIHPRTARRWSRGPYVRSATVSAVDSGDVGLVVADVHVAGAVRRRLR